MRTTVKHIAERLKDAPQEVLDKVSGYLDAIHPKANYTIPDWQVHEVEERLERLKTGEETKRDWEEAKENLFKSK